MGCCRWYLAVGLGLGTTATALIFLFAWSDIFDILVAEEKSILPGSVLYKEWRRPTTYPSWQIYVYNWSNAQTFLHHPQEATMASFQEFGPYVYEEITEVVDVKYHPSNGTLSYRKRTFFRRSNSLPAHSNGTNPEEFTSVNFAALVASHVGLRMDYSVQRELSFLLHNHHQNLTLTKPIGQLLFTGYREPMMEPLRRLVCTGRSHGMPCQDERLAYFRTFNVSRRTSDVYSLDVGLKDRSSYGIVRSSGTAYSEPHPCTGFADLTGELFPSRIVRGDAIAIVLPELCRRFTLEFDREVLVEGITGFRYDVRPFDGESVDASDMRSSCADMSSRLGRYGILNTAECNGLPLYESASEYESSNGSITDSEPYFVVEPVTGTVLESSIGLAYHTVLRPNEHIALFQSVPEVRVPLFRFVRVHRLGELKTAKLRQLLHLLDVGHQLALAGCIAGVTIILLAITFACWQGRKSSKTVNDQYRVIGTQLRDGRRESLVLK